MQQRTKLAIVVGVMVLVAAGASAGGFAWHQARQRTAVRAGWGPYAAELEACRKEFEKSLDQFRGRYLTNTNWYQGEAKALRIGGKVVVTDFQNQQVRFDYECWVTNGQVVRVGTR